MRRAQRAGDDPMRELASDEAQEAACEGEFSKAIAFGIVAIVAELKGIRSELRIIRRERERERSERDDRALQARQRAAGLR